jgi:hypothetical protein
VRISIAIFSYLGGLNFGVTADYDSTPDIEVLCDGIEAGIQEYLAIAGAAAGKNGVGTKRAQKRVARAGASPRRSTTRRRLEAKPQRHYVSATERLKT